MEKEKDSKPSQEEEKVKETSQKKVQEIPVKEQNKEEKPVEEKKVVKEKPEIDFEDLSGFELEQSFELPDLPSLTHDVKDITTKSVKPSETEAPELQLPKELQTMLGGQSAIAKTVAPPEEAKSKRTGRRGAQSSDEPGKVSSLRSVSQTVRVDIKKLDVLMNIVGELVLSKSNLGRISDLLKLQAGFTGLAVDLFKETRQLERKLDELQSGVMEVRLVQVRQVFDKLSRVVRKISRDAGKDISFEIAGADTELDKLIIEELSDPLMHLIRNCIDHGVETPAEREAKGKPGQGTIAVSAYQKGNHVIIEIRDDGAGLDTEKICSIAMEKNLVDPYKIGELSERDIHNFIFLPGFSTKDEVSEISGRGVGMDVVKTNIANLSGMIDVFSKKNEGTLFTITLPITLAIIKALIIESGQNIFAIPLNGVIEILTIDREDILTIERREVIQLRDQTVPLTRLADLFRIDADEEDRSRYFTVIVGLAQNKLGIIVDKMLNQQDIVIKPLGRALNKINGFAGATDLGNQETILVLDIGALIEEALSLHQMEA